MKYEVINKSEEIQNHRINIKSFHFEWSSMTINALAERLGGSVIDHLRRVVMNGVPRCNIDKPATLPWKLSDYSPLVALVIVNIMLLY